MNDRSVRDSRLDLTKAIAISLVLLWHLQPIQITVIKGSGPSIKLLKYLMYQFNFQITLVAVPLFFLVSIFLFFERMQDRIADYSKKRLLRIMEIFIFWTIFQTLVFLITRLIAYFQTGVFNFQFSIPKFIVQGGPGLPIIGGSVFYFLFVLLGLIIFAALYGIFWKKERFLTIISVILIIISVSFFEFKNINHAHLPNWRIDNFLIYVPITYLLWRNEKDKLIYFIPLLFLGYTLFSTYDLYLNRVGIDSGIYGRLSIALGATALFSTFLQFRSLKENKIILFLSTYSLGIFAIHKYWQLILLSLLQNTGLYMRGSLATHIVNIWELTISIVVIGLTVMSILLLRRTPLKRYIM